MSTQSPWSSVQCPTLLPRYANFASKTKGQRPQTTCPRPRCPRYRSNMTNCVARHGDALAQRLTAIAGEAHDGLNKLNYATNGNDMFAWLPAARHTFTMTTLGLATGSANCNSLCDLSRDSPRDSSHIRVPCAVHLHLLAHGRPC